MTEDPNRTIQSVADAGKSIGDATQSAIKLADKALTFLARILGEDAAGLLKDKLYYWRAKNALALQDKLNNELARRKLEHPEAIPLRLAIPFLEAATL